MKTIRPVEIPERFHTDRATKALITSWVNLHARHKVCRRRVYWAKPVASVIEKKRRKEQWRILARILEIERTLLLWLAKATKHPDIYTSPNPDKPNSRIRELESRYYQNRKDAHHLSGEPRKVLLERRARIVAEKRAIERRWMIALCRAVDPEIKIPNAIPRHPREMLPRKLARASRELLSDFI